MKNEEKNGIADNEVDKVDSNPFIVLVDEYLSTENMWTRLATSPRDGIVIASLDKQARLDMLDRLQEEFFEPTSISVDIATRILRLIRKGYINRDPTKPKVRQLTMKIAEHVGSKQCTLPWFATYAKGMTVVGITGLGKSYEVERALQLVPQCIEHGPSIEAGWIRMKQVTWLKVGMSHDGSLGGLLLQILCALDDAVGTDYSQDKALIKLSNEKLAVRIFVIFRNHGLGVLVIDEIQEKNFDGHGRGELAATFFLRLLNIGIPVVLIGNPYGFEALYKLSHDVRRVGSGGTITMHPHQQDDFDWDKCLLPALLKQNLMSEQSPITLPKELIYKYSGGIREYGCRIVVATQRLAIDLGDSYITEDHMEQAYLGSDFSDKDRSIIEGFRDKDPRLLVGFEDIPWESYASKWGLFEDKKSSSDSGNNQVNDGTSSGEDFHEAQPIKDSVRPVYKKDLQTDKRNRTKEENNKTKRTKSINSLSPDDMRADGMREFLIKGFDSLLNK